MNISRTLPKCNPGFYYAHQPPPGVKSDRGWCYTCSAGTYSDERNREAQCKSCTGCSQELGLVEVQPCRPTADALCRCLDHNASENGRCQLIAVVSSRRTTVEAEKGLLVAEIPKAVRFPGVLRATIDPVEVGEANLIYEPAAVKSTKSSHSSTMERAAHTSGIRFPLEWHEARRVETTIDLGVESRTEIQAQSAAFYFGSIPVTTAMLAMGIVSFVSLIALAAVAVTLCVKRRQRSNGRKPQSVEVYVESDYHVYEDPETLIPAISSPLRICVTAAASDAPGYASQSQDHPSSSNASENSFALLLDNQILSGDEAPASCDIEHAPASNCEERNLSASHIAQPVIGASSSEAQVWRTNFLASEICGCADGVAARNAAAADSKTGGCTGAVTARWIDLSASSEIRAGGGSSDQSELACTAKSGAAAAAGLRDGGYIYSRTWEQLRRPTRPT